MEEYPMIYNMFHYIRGSQTFHVHNFRFLESNPPKVVSTPQQLWVKSKQGSTFARIGVNMKTCEKQLNPPRYPCEIWKIWWIIEMPQGTWFLDGLEWRDRVLQQNSGMLFTDLFFQDQNRLEGMVWLIHPDYPNITSKTHLAVLDPEKKNERLILGAN